MPIIEVKNLKKSYGTKILFDRFNLELEEGKMTALMGQSGCGKTTLLNMIGLIEPIDDGEVRIMNTRIPKTDSRKAARFIREHISFLFQNFALIEDENVENNLMLALEYVPGNKWHKRKLIRNVLTDIGLSGTEKQKVCELSGGQQQRIALARAILKPGEIILADEPTGSLDADNREIVMKLMRQMVQNGKTVVIVTHDPAAARMCDRVIRLDSRTQKPQLKS